METFGLASLVALFSGIAFLFGVYRGEENIREEWRRAEKGCEDRPHRERVGGGQ